ncbi:MAG: hypothetical protein AB1393_09030 [Candidatus Edwardsbacteria bacterium]
MPDISLKFAKEAVTEGNMSETEIQCYLALVTVFLAGCGLTLSLPFRKKSGDIRHTSKILPDSSKIEEFYPKDLSAAMDSALAPLGAKMQKIPFLAVAYNKSKKPLQEAKVTIKVPGKADTIIYTGKDGKANFFLDRDILSLDPVCVLEGGASYEFRIDFTTLRLPKESKLSCIPKIISVEGKEKIEEENIAVYFQKGQEEKAKEVFDFLKKEECLIEEKLGLQAETPWGIILTDETPPLSSSQRRLWPVSIEEIEKQYYMIIHEWTEVTLLSQCEFYENDPTTRWIGDGIATLMQYFFLERFSRNELREVNQRKVDLIRRCIDRGLKTYDLGKWKAGIIPTTEDERLGYTLSLYVWLKIIEHSKEGILIQFLEEAKKLKEVNNKNLIRLLTNLSGLNIEKMLKKVNVEEAYNYLKNLNP